MAEKKIDVAVCLEGKGLETFQISSKFYSELIQKLEVMEEWVE